MLCLNIVSDIMFCRLEDKASQSAQRGIPNGSISADVLELNKKSSYSTFQHNDNQMRYRDRSDFAYRWKNSSLYREAEAIEEDGQGILEVLNTAQAANDWGHTIEDWGKATEECRKNKRLFAHGNNTSAKLKTNTGDNRRKTIYDEGRALSRKETQFTGNGRQHVHRISHNQISLGHVGSRVVSYPNHDKKIVSEGHVMTIEAHPSSLGSKRVKGPKPDKDEVFNIKETASTDNEVVPSDDVGEPFSEKITHPEYSELHERLSQVYEKVLVVDSIHAAREVVHLLTTQYKDLVHACDTEACIALL